MHDGGPWFTVVAIGDDTFLAHIDTAVSPRHSLLITGAGDADQGFTTAVGRAPDVVVVADPPGPGTETTDLVARIHGALPASRILVVVDGRPSDPVGLARAGVGGIVALDDDLDSHLPEAVEALATGEGVVDASLAEAVLACHRAGSTASPLSATEEEVLTRLAEGTTAAALATEHAVTPRLVRQHAGGALARLHPGRHPAAGPGASPSPSS